MPSPPPSRSPSPTPDKKLKDDPSALRTAEYWDSRYKTAEGDTSSSAKPTHEWFRDFSSLEPFFAKNLFPQWKGREHEPRILHLGNGDSTIPYSLLSHSYTNQLCIDFSLTVVTLMRSRHPATTSSPHVTWSHDDVRQLTSVPTSSIDVAFDKGTLDAMIWGSPWDPPDQVIEDSTKYMEQVVRVLKDDGVFLYVTYRQPHFVRPIFNRGEWWDVEVEVLGEGGFLEYFGFVLRKRGRGKERGNGEGSEVEGEEKVEEVGV